MAHADHRPFRLHSLLAPEQKSAEATCFLDLPEDRLHDCFSAGIGVASFLGAEFSAHSLACVSVFGDRTVGYYIVLVSVLPAPSGDVDISAQLFACLGRLWGPVTSICCRFVRGAATVVLHLFDNGYQVSVVGGLVANGLAHDDLPRTSLRGFGLEPWSQDGALSDTPRPAAFTQRRSAS